VRGQPEDYDHWKSLGNDGWSFDEVLPYFRKCEDHEGSRDKDKLDESLHGIDGPLSVASSSSRFRRQVN
jgi:choline dehydrogenase